MGDGEVQQQTRSEAPQQAARRGYEVWRALRVQDARDPGGRRVLEVLEVEAGDESGAFDVLVKVGEATSSTREGACWDVVERDPALLEQARESELGPRLAATTVDRAGVVLQTYNLKPRGGFDRVVS